MSTTRTQSGLENISDRLFSTKGLQENEFNSTFCKISEQRGTFYSLQISFFKMTLL